MTTPAGVGPDAHCTASCPQSTRRSLQLVELALSDRRTCDASPSPAGVDLGGLAADALMQLGLASLVSTMIALRTQGGILPRALRDFLAA